MKEKNKTPNGSLTLTNGYQLIISILFISSCIYTYSTRSTADFIKNTIYASIGFSVLILFVLFMAWVGSGYKKATIGSIFFSIFSTIMASLIFGLFIYSLGAPLKDFFIFLTKPSIPKSKAILLVIITTLLLGSLLFFWRLRFRAIYGLTEAIVGLWVAGDRVSIQELDLDKISSYLTILTAAVYLVVRGLDNIHQGLFKEPCDPAASWLLERNETLAKFLGNKKDMESIDLKDKIQT